MPFPVDPNAPGGPRRSEYLRSCFAAPGASVTDQRPEPDVSVRLSTVDDEDCQSLRRLASVNDSPTPSGPVVLEVDGDPGAALSLRDGDTLADPSRSSSSITGLLHMHRLAARVIGAIWGV